MRARDPLAFFRRATASRIDSVVLDRIDAAALADVDAAWEAARIAAWPSLDAVTRDVYTTWPEEAR